MSKCCRQCNFSSYDNDHYEWECRKNPPIINISNYSNNKSSIFPIIDDPDEYWCGAFESDEYT